MGAACGRGVPRLSLDRDARFRTWACRDQAAAGRRGRHPGKVRPVEARMGRTDGRTGEDRIMTPGIGDFFRGLFGGLSAAEPPAEAAEDYKGFTILPAPHRQGGQWTTEAVITKVVEGTTKEHRLIRADLFAARDDAIAASLTKAKRTIDEQGDKIFGA